MQRDWRGIEGVETDKRWVRVCRTHRAALTETGHSQLTCTRGCVVEVPSGVRAGIGLEECPFEVVEVKAVRPVSRGSEMEDWSMPSGIYDRSKAVPRDERRETRDVSTKDPKGKVLQTATFHSEAGHRIWITLERSKLVPFVVRIKHKSFEGPTTKGQLAAGEKLEDVQAAFTEQIHKAKGMQWQLGAPVTGLTDIPRPDEIPEAAGARRKKGTRRAA